jgi:glycosyltransferase involved in cell wall biosynthesis
MHFQVTVFTPTYNRAHTLGRVYSSLCKQDYRDFCWLIIDDGSVDGTKDLVDKWIAEGIINITYLFKENGGKYTAMDLAFRMAKSKYIVIIDSDDELVENALVYFIKEWEELELLGIADNFAEIAGMTYEPDGKLVGDFCFPANCPHIDSFWQEMVLKKRNNNEHVSCWDLDKLNTFIQIPEKIWLKEEVDFSIYFFELTMWARIGKWFKTRYLNKCLRVYYKDSGDSLMRITASNKIFYNNLISNKYFLDENLEYFWWNPHYFLNLILKFIISGIALKKSPNEIQKAIKTVRFKLVYLTFLPIGFIAYIYFRFIRKNFWFKSD